MRANWREGNNFYSPEWPISNFSCSFTRNITSHSMKNLVFIAYSGERWLYYQFSLPHVYLFLLGVVRTLSLNLVLIRLRSKLDQVSAFHAGHTPCYSPFCAASPELWIDFRERSGTCGPLLGNRKPSSDWLNTAAKENSRRQWVTRPFLHFSPTSYTVSSTASAQKLRVAP